MPRNGSGSYSLPAGNPVSSGTLIEASWANTTLSDLASAMTDSLARSGEGGMTGPLRATDGTVSVPSISFVSETASGFYRAGATDVRFAMAGVDVATLTTAGVTVGSTKVLALPDGTAAAPALTNTGDTNTGVFFPDADTVGVSTGGTERVRVDASGNLGLGVTPATWRSGAKAFQFGSVGAVWQQSNGYINLGYNAYEDGTNTFKYIFSDAAARFGVINGYFAWFTAPSGTAGDAISFTQAMSLDASGNLGVGTTSIACRGDFRGASGLGVQFQETSSGNSTRIQLGTSANVGYINADAGIGTIALSFLTAGTERARITSGGDLLVGTTNAAVGTATGFRLVTSASTADRAELGSSGTTDTNIGWSMYSTGATAYRFYVGYGGTIYATSATISAISDQRFKENIRDLDVGLNSIMALKPRKFDWKAGKGKDIKDDRGFIAQEFEQIFPDLIDEWKDPAPEGEEPYKAVRADLIPVLVKAIQEQQAIIQSLTARIEALEAAA